MITCCDIWCNILNHAFVHFHSCINLTPLDLIFGMMLVHDMSNMYKKFHDHLILFCFVFIFLMWISNCVHLVCLYMTWIIWCLSFMSWTWSFLGHLLDGLNVHYARDQLLFWLFDLPLTLVFVLVVCSHQLCLMFQVFSNNDWFGLISWDANYFDH
jgi:hypothetical protein